MDDPLIAALQRHSRAPRFCSATREVVAGADLYASGHQSYGANVYVATDGPPAVPVQVCVIGRSIAAGHVEAFDGCALRCTKEDGDLVVRVVDDSGRSVTRELRRAVGEADACDEGLLAWFGPVEEICTPWSDNEPAQCQVVTVDRLRRYARERNAAGMVQRAAARMQQILTELLDEAQCRALASDHVDRLPDEHCQAFLACLAESHRLCPDPTDVATLCRYAIEEHEALWARMAAEVGAEASPEEAFGRAQETALAHLEDWSYTRWEKEAWARRLVRIFVFVFTS